MIRIEKLVLQNFGPYYDRQEIVFPKDDGVCIVWGLNGYGKTTITNAFRYALWNTIYGRKRAIKEARSYVNTDAEKEHKDMMVELYLSVERINYTITRGLRNTGGDVYQNVFSIERNGTIFGPDQAEEWLANLLPFEISRFYVFDGELLEEYEDLLDEGSVGNDKLREAIEDILGIPMLINARENMKTLVNEADSEVQKEATKSKETKTLADSLEEANEKRQELLISKSELEEELRAKTEESADIEDKLKRHPKLRDLINNKKMLKENVQRLDDKIAENKEKIKTLIDNLWESVISEVITSIQDSESISIKDLQEASRKSYNFKCISEYIEDLLKEDHCHCPFCKEKKDEKLLFDIFMELKQKKSELLSFEEEKRLADSQKIISALNVIQKTKQDFSYPRALIDDVREEEAELAVTHNDIDNLEKEIKTYGGEDGNDLEEELAKLPSKLKTCLKEIEIIKEGLEENREALEIVEKSIIKCNEEIKKRSSSIGLKKATQKRDILYKLQSIFEESIASFRMKIKNNIEKDATESFVQISHQYEFKSLRINDMFGLNIIKADGTAVPNRSSGYEQVVAIALISALHKNAPIAGPVFLDSTFQRVDTPHKKKTLQNLTVLSNQVIILAYPDEIGDENEVRKILGAQLKKELSISQLTSSKSYFE
jgi:DNA sulfur modification protein DndD